jgi:hypothetical protein
MQRNAHILKSWPVFFDAIMSGRKTFEVRYDDRHYQANDVVILREYNPDPMFEGTDQQRYSGREVQFTIGWMLHGEAWGLQDGYCAFSLVDRQEIPRKRKEDDAGA